MYSSNTPAAAQKSWRDISGKILAVCSLSFPSKSANTTISPKSLEVTFRCLSQAQGTVFLHSGSILHTGDILLLNKKKRRSETSSHFFQPVAAADQKTEESDRTEKKLSFRQGKGAIRKARTGKHKCKFTRMLERV